MRGRLHLPEFRCLSGRDTPKITTLSASDQPDATDTSPPPMSILKRPCAAPDVARAEYRYCLVVVVAAALVLIDRTAWCVVPATATSRRAR